MDRSARQPAGLWRCGASPAASLRERPPGSGHSQVRTQSRGGVPGHRHRPQGEPGGREVSSGTRSGSAQSSTSARGPYGLRAACRVRVVRQRRGDLEVGPAVTSSDRLPWAGRRPEQTGVRPVSPPSRSQLRSPGVRGSPAQHSSRGARPRSTVISWRNRRVLTEVSRVPRRGAARTCRTRHASNPRSGCPTARSRRWPGSGAERAGPGGCGCTNRWRPR